MNKSQQMRWTRRSADLLLQARCTVCNSTFGSGFGQRFAPANDIRMNLAAVPAPKREAVPATSGAGRGGIASGEDYVARQRARVAALERDGCDTAQAKRRLMLFETILAVQVADRDRLWRELEAQDRSQAEAA